MGKQAEEAFRDLLQRAQGGDREACQRLFDRLGGEGEEAEALHRMARRILPPGDRMRDFVESRDLMQSALKSGWLRLEGFRGETAEEFLGWMRAIIRRKLGRVVRRRMPRPGGEVVEEAAQSPVEGTGTGLAALVREEAKARVRSAVEGLPEHERAVMEMRLRGLNSVQIAEVLGIEPAAVRKRESRAAERLRSLLGSSGLPGED